MADYNRTVITFADGTTVTTTLPPKAATATYQSALRRTLEYRIPYDSMGFTELEALYKDTAATAEAVVTEYGTDYDENGDPVEAITGQSLHLNFTMPVELTLKTVDGAQVWCMKMAQMSDVELKQEQHAEELAITQMAVMELAALNGGV